MKKHIPAIIGAVIAIAFIIVIVVIANQNKNSASPAPTDADSTTAATVGEIKTLDDYVAQLKAYFDRNGGMDDDYTTGRLYADADGLVFDYTLREQNAGGTLEQVQDAVKSLLDGNEENYYDAVDEMNAATGGKYRVKVIFRNADNSVIDERDYR